MTHVPTITCGQCGASAPSGEYADVEHDMEIDGRIRAMWSNLVPRFPEFTDEWDWKPFDVYDSAVLTIWAAEVRRLPREGTVSKNYRNAALDSLRYKYTDLYAEQKGWDPKGPQLGYQYLMKNIVEINRGLIADGVL